MVDTDWWYKLGRLGDPLNLPVDESFIYKWEHPPESPVVLLKDDHFGNGENLLPAVSMMWGSVEYQLLNQRESKYTSDPMVKHHICVISHIQHTEYYVEAQKDSLWGLFWFHLHFFQELMVLLTGIIIIVIITTTTSLIIGFSHSQIEVIA